MPLPELKQFIRQNGHLPDVPTAKEVGNNGLNVGEMNTILLKKIEQLTIYILKQQDEIDKLKKKINE